MIIIIDISFFTAEYLGIFILMFSTFLIGYFSSWWMQKNKYDKKIKHLYKKINTVIKSNNTTYKNKNIRNIETVYSEINPRKKVAINESPEQHISTKTQKNIAKKARTSYITYTKTKPKLNFDNFGEASFKDRDDLTKLQGIGPYIEQKLNEVGIFTYDQISRFTFEDIRIITELIDFFPDRINRDNWVGQAKSLKVK